MASIYLAKPGKQGGEWIDYPHTRLLESHAADRSGSHRLVSDPASADLILFATNHGYPPIGMGLLADPIFRRHASRCVLFNSSDYPSPIFGGLCASWPSDYNSQAIAAGWCYLHQSSAEPHIELQPLQSRPRYLWSFLGSLNTHPIRERIFGLGDPESFVADTSQISLPNLSGLSSPAQRREFIQSYVANIRDSAFVVCPRGKGASSMRIFEAMRAGRAPVILSDAWTPPPFISWDHCSLRIPENETSGLPEFLRERRDSAQELGQRARQEWERVFGPAGLFHHSVEASLGLLKARQAGHGTGTLKGCSLLLRPPWPRMFARECKSAILAGLKSLH